MDAAEKFVAAIVSRFAPCRAELEAYTHCMKRHEGKAPDSYEEYCEDEKEAYISCRAERKKDK